MASQAVSHRNLLGTPPRPPPPLRAHKSQASPSASPSAAPRGSPRALRCASACESASASPGPPLHASLLAWPSAPAAVCALSGPVRPTQGTGSFPGSISDQPRIDTTSNLVRPQMNLQVDPTSVLNRSASTPRPPKATPGRPHISPSQMNPKLAPSRPRWAPSRPHFWPRFTSPEHTSIPFNLFLLTSVQQMLEILLPCAANKYSSKARRNTLCRADGRAETAK